MLHNTFILTLILTFALNLSCFGTDNSKSKNSFTETVEIKNNLGTKSLNNSSAASINFSGNLCTADKYFKNKSFVYIRQDGTTFASSDMFNWRKILSKKAVSASPIQKTESLIITGNNVNLDIDDGTNWKLFDLMGVEICNGTVRSGILEFSDLQLGCYIIIAGDKVVKVLKTEL